MAIAQECSINAASKKLYISPQALSRSLIHLEEELHVKLMERSRYGVVLTEKGEQLSKAASQFLNQLDKISENSSKYGNLLSSKGLGYFLPNLLAEIYLAAPNVHITIDYSTYHDILEKVSNQVVELALMNISLTNGQRIYEFDDNQFMFYPVREYRYFCRLNKNLSIADYKTVSLKTLSEYPLILNSNTDKYSFLTLVKDFCEPKKVIFEENENLADGVMHAGLGVSVALAEWGRPLPKSSDTNIVHIEITDDIRTIFGFVVKKNNILSAKTKALIQILKSIAR